MPEPSREAVEALFQHAADLAPARRGAFLDERCAGDADLRAAVEELLRIDAQTQGDPEFLQGPVAGVRAALAPTQHSCYEGQSSEPKTVNLGRRGGSRPSVRVPKISPSRPTLR